MCVHVSAWFLRVHAFDALCVSFQHPWACKRMRELVKAAADGRELTSKATVPLVDPSLPPPVHWQQGHQAAEVILSNTSCPFTPEHL